MDKMGLFWEGPIFQDNNHQQLLNIIYAISTKTNESNLRNMNKFGPIFFSQKSCFVTFLDSLQVSLMQQKKTGNPNIGFREKVVTDERTNRRNV